MNYQVVIEGQEIPVPEEIGADDESVKRALAPFYPNVATAMITRVEKDDTMTITVVKKAGTKGSASAALDHLTACPGGRNPAIAVYVELSFQDLDPETLLSRSEEITAAIRQGEGQANAIEMTLARLVASHAQPAPYTVVGF